MSIYNDYFDNISYDFNGDGIEKQTKNLAAKLVIDSRLKNNANLYSVYDIKEGETPQSVAKKLYGSSDLYWAILLVNDIVDPYHDWCLSGIELKEHLMEKFDGAVFHLDKINDNSSSSSQSETSISSNSSSTDSVSSSSSSSLTLSSQSISTSSNSSNLSSSSSDSSSSTQADNSSSSSSSSSTNRNSSSSSSSSYWTSASSSSSSLHSSSSSSNSLSSSSSSSSEVYEIFTKGETVEFPNSVRGIVKSWDPTYRKLVLTDVQNTSGTAIVVSTLDGTIVEGLTSGAQGTVGRVVTYEYHSLYQFENVDGIVLDPRKNINGYINGSDTNAVTVFEYFDRVNETKRKIKVLNGLGLSILQDQLRVKKYGS